jgi:hypothetical protein
MFVAFAAAYTSRTSHTTIHVPRRQALWRFYSFPSRREFFWTSLLALRASLQEALSRGFPLMIWPMG